MRIELENKQQKQQILFVRNNRTKEKRKIERDIYICMYVYDQLS